MSFHPLILPNGASNACPSPTRNILERTKLQKLPSLPKREIFQLSQEKTANVTNCPICSKSLKNEAEICQSVNVCRACLKIHAEVEIQLNQAAEMKSLEITRTRFLGKLEAK